MKPIVREFHDQEIERLETAKMAGMQDPAVTAGPKKASSKKKKAKKKKKVDRPYEVGLFNIGDDVDVHYKIVEGEKERIQVFSGTVLRKKGSGLTLNFTVRRIVQNEGVERIFPMYGPRMMKVLVTRRGRIRRSKLYYLRDRVGKATKTPPLLGRRADRLKKLEEEKFKSLDARYAALAAANKAADAGTVKDA